MCSAESPAAPLSRSALRESRSYRPYPTTPPYPRHLGCFAALARASRLASRASLNWFLRGFMPLLLVHLPLTSVLCVRIRQPCATSITPLSYVRSAHTLPVT